MPGVHLEDIKVVVISEHHEADSGAFSCEQYEDGNPIGFNTGCFPKMLEEDITTVNFPFGLTSADFGGVTPAWIRVRIDGTVSNRYWSHGCVGPTDPDALYGCDTVFATGETEIVSHPTQISGIRFNRGGPYPFPSFYTLEESLNIGLLLNPSPSYTGALPPGMFADEFWPWGSLESLELHWAGQANTFGFGFGLYIQGFSNTTDDGDATPIYVKLGASDGDAHSSLFESIQRGPALRSPCPWVSGTTTLCFACSRPLPDWTGIYGPIGGYPEGHTYDDYDAGFTSPLAELDSFNPDYCTISAVVWQFYDIKCHNPLCSAGPGGLGCGPLQGLPGASYKFNGVGGVQIMNLSVTSGGRYVSMDIAPWEQPFFPGPVTYASPGVPDHLIPADPSLMWPWKLAKKMIPLLGHGGQAWTWIYRYSVDVQLYFLDEAASSPVEQSFVFHSYF
jgi:hypothetical protein